MILSADMTVSLFNDLIGLLSALQVKLFIHLNSGRAQNVLHPFDFPCQDFAIPYDPFFLVLLTVDLSPKISIPCFNLIALLRDQLKQGQFASVVLPHLPQEQARNQHTGCR